MGPFVGCDDGWLEGWRVGPFVGSSVGLSVGFSVGCDDGGSVGCFRTFYCMGNIDHKYSLRYKKMKLQVSFLFHSHWWVEPDLSIDSVG